MNQDCVAISWKGKLFFWLFNSQSVLLICSYTFLLAFIKNIVQLQVYLFIYLFSHEILHMSRYVESMFSQTFANRHDGRCSEICWDIILLVQYLWQVSFLLFLLGGSSLLFSGDAYINFRFPGDGCPAEESKNKNYRRSAEDSARSLRHKQFPVWGPDPRDG